MASTPSQGGLPPRPRGRSRSPRPRARRMLARRGYLGLSTNHPVPDRAERVQGAGQKRFPSADASGRSLADVPTGQRCHDNAYDARDYENEPLVPRSHVLLFPGHDQDLPVTRSTTSSDGTRTMRTRMKPSRFDHRAAPRAPVVHVDISREAAVNLNIHVLENTAAGTTRRPGDAWPSSLPRVVGYVEIAWQGGFIHQRT